MVKSRRAASSSWLPKTLSRRMRPCSSVSWSAEAGARSGRLDDLLAEDHVHQLEAPADDARAAEQRADLLGRGIGGHVEVLGFQAHDQVAHGAAYDIGFIAVLAQDFADLDGMPGDIAAVDAVLVAGDALRASVDGPEQASDDFRMVSVNHQDLWSSRWSNMSSTCQPRCSAVWRRLGLGLVAMGRVTTSSKWEYRWWNRCRRKTRRSRSATAVERPATA